MSKIIDTHRVSHIFHLAADSVTSSYEKRPLESYYSTVYGTVVVLEAARNAKIPIQKIIVSTSSKVYGKAVPPYNESTPFLPQTPYETAKACQDLISQDYYRSFNLPVILFRTVNIYGPYDTSLTKLVSRSFARALTKQPPVVYSSSKDVLREFLYIDDLIDALILMFEKAVPGDAFCVGGELHTVSEVVETICNYSGYSEGYHVEDTGPALEEKENRLDSSKIQSLGWKAKTTLSEGLQKSKEYYTTLLSNV
jgi:nucleoside-diphosphate-sugar epimerase